MRQLTFVGFLKEYVKDLSDHGAPAVKNLAKEVMADNPRLKEPLFIYCLYSDNLSLLLKVTKDTPVGAEYEAMAKEYNTESMMQAFEGESIYLPKGYLKVYKTFKSIAGIQERDEKIKELIRLEVLKIITAKNISVYRMSKDLNINNANVNAWIKDGFSTKVSLDNARTMLQYAKDQESRALNIVEEPEPVPEPVVDEVTGAIEYDDVVENEKPYYTDDDIEIDNSDEEDNMDEYKADDVEPYYPEYEPENIKYDDPLEEEDVSDDFVLDDEDIEGITDLRLLEDDHYEDEE